MSRLDDLNIRLMVQGAVVSIYVRENCIAAVGGNESGNQGSTGLMTEQGLAYLVWREGQPYLAMKGGETPATPEQVETIRKFSQDLNDALGNEGWHEITAEDGNVKLNLEHVLWVRTESDEHRVGFGIGGR